VLLEYNASEISNNTLFNQVLPPFKAAVDAGLKTVMTSFNTINGIPASGDKFLLRDVLKQMGIQWICNFRLGFYKRNDSLGIF
jgi:beta-glucosidase-like glycosyl hydrolase